MSFLKLYSTTWRFIHIAGVGCLFLFILLSSASFSEPIDLHDTSGDNAAEYFEEGVGFEVTDEDGNKYKIF